uniref:Uncharacterized protein n=1 Tax=Marmota marmota marmota TaxID=9994 RepID=A0A8C6A8E6_MARMA
MWVTGLASLPEDEDTDDHNGEHSEEDTTRTRDMPAFYTHEERLSHGTAQGRDTLEQEGMLSLSGSSRTSADGAGAGGGVAGDTEDPLRDQEDGREGNHTAAAGRGEDAGIHH